MEERLLRYDPLFVGELTNACCALHNICRLADMPHFPIEFERIRDNRAPVPLRQRNRLRAEGLRIRQDIIDTYF